MKMKLKIPRRLDIVIDVRSVSHTTFSYICVYIYIYTFTNSIILCHSYTYDIIFITIIYNLSVSSPIKLSSSISMLGGTHSALHILVLIV
jgi:hypothetical protein